MDRVKFRSDVYAACTDQLGADFFQKMDAVNIVPNRRIHSCGLADMVSVLANGNVVPCTFAPDPSPLCNIKDIGDGDGREFILHLAERLERLVNSTRVEKLSPCADCDIRYFCGGKCRKENVEDCGNLNVCECDELYKQGWYEELVLIDPYVVEPITDL